MNNKAIIYCRISSETQTKDIRINRQQELCMKYASQHNYQIVEFVSDIGSGLDNNRDGFKQILEFVKTKRGDVLVCGVDRLTRDYTLFAEIKNKFEEAGIKLLTVVPIDLCGLANYSQKKNILNFLGCPLN